MLTIQAELFEAGAIARLLCVLSRLRRSSSGEDGVRTGALRLFSHRPLHSLCGPAVCAAGAGAGNQSLSE